MVDSKDFTKFAYCKSRRPDNCLLMLADDMIVLLDETFTIQYASPAFIQTFAKRVDDWSHQSFFQFVNNEDKYQVGDALECSMRMPEEKISVQYQFSVDDGDKSFYYEMIVKNHFADKSAGFLLLDIRDITDRMILQGRIIEQDQRWRIIFEQAKDAMVVVDQRGMFLAINQVICNKLGYSEDELFLSNILKIIAPEFRESAQARLLGDFHDNADIFESAYLKKDGSVLPVELSCGFINFNSQNCLLAVVRDISARKQLEAEKEQLQKQFLQSQKMETVGRLAAGIAHDFNNLLTILMNNLGLLEIDLATIDPFRPLIDECQKAVSQAANLTRQLLTFSRPSISEELEIINVSEVLKSMHSMLKRLLPETINLSMQIFTKVFIQMNKANLEQIIVNLIVNARDAIDSSGEIGIVLKNEDGQACLSVQDTGVGIPLELQEKIFEPFFSTKEKTGGTGLGLFTVYGLVYKANGKLTLKSELGKGSVFSLYFPMVEEKMFEEKQKGYKGFFCGNASILLVEDELGIMEVAIKVLQRAHYKVFACTSAEEALLLCQNLPANQKIDLLFTDVTLPGMTGIVLAKKLREAKVIRRCLLTSGYVYDPKSLTDIEDNDGDEWKIEFIGKPYKINDLLGKIKVLLD